MLLEFVRVLTDIHGEMTLLEALRVSIENMLKYLAVDSQDGNGPASSFMVHNGLEDGPCRTARIAVRIFHCLVLIGVNDGRNSEWNAMASAIGEGDDKCEGVAMEVTTSMISILLYLPRDLSFLPLLSCRSSAEHRQQAR